MPKKQRNSFYFFMLDYKSQQENLGRRFNGGLGCVSEEAGNIWKDMPSHARAKYEKQAKEYKNNGPGAKKYTSTGETIDAVLARKQEYEEAELQKRETVMNLVSDRTTAMSKAFFLIDVNFYCQTTKLFVINEVSVSAFDVVNGIMLVYHKIIDPGSIPTGYAAAAKETFDEHCFGLPPLENGENDLTRVVSEIMDFLEECKVDVSCSIPLFTLEEKIPAVQSFFEQIAVKHPEAYRFDLYSLSTLFFALSQKLCMDPNQALPNDSVASITLRADKFQYHDYLACDFHEVTDKYYNCSKSRVKRWAYTMLDYLCPLANVEIISGDHVPDSVDPEKAAIIKAQQEEQREQKLREQRERDASVKFSFIDYSTMNPEERRRQDMMVTAAQSVCSSAHSRNAWPTLAGPVPRTVSAEPKTVWGKPAGGISAEPKTMWGKPAESTASSNSTIKPEAKKPAWPGLSPVATAGSTRTPLRRPGCTPQGMLAKLEATSGDSLGIARGRGRGSIASINSE